MSTNTATAVALEDSLTAKEKIAKMVGEKDEKDLNKSDRLYYGVPRWRGCETKNKGVHVLNSGFTMLVDNEQRYNAIMRNPAHYAELLQDQFYRHFMGYPEHFCKAPEHPSAIKVYNKVAVETGHPEYVIGQIIYAEGKSAKDNESSNDTVEKIDPSKVDVVDNDGNVIATSEECAAAANTGNGSGQKKATEDSKPSKDTEKKESEPKQPKQEKKGEPKKDESAYAKKNDAKDKKEYDAQSSVIFNETSRDGRKFDVDKNRHNEFKEVNAPVIKRYPGVEKLVDACKKQNKLVCLRLKDPDTDKSYNGLIYATIFDRGVPGSAHSVYIDPAKIRNHYSFIRPAAVPNQVFPFECPMVSFDRYLDEYIATNGQLSPESAKAVDDECMPNYKFLYHVMYSSIPEADLSYVATVLAPLFFEIDRSNLSIRFKAIDYTSKYSFTLYCAEDVGLGKYAKDNARFNGLKVSVRVASEKDIKFRATGKHAQEFRDILFNNSLGAFDIKLSTNDAKSPEQKDNEKPNPEHGKKQDKKDQESKQPKQEKQQKQEKKEPEVNPAEVVKSVEEQKPEIQTTFKTPEEKAAEAERAANFAEAMRISSKTAKVIEASSAIH